MSDVKPFWASVTLWGAVATFVGIVLPGFGVSVSPSALNNFFSSFQQMLDSILTFGGLLAVTYGRVKATKQVSLTG
jgi:uncharacterized protein YjeT (DUF2065 family)